MGSLEGSLWFLVGTVSEAGGRGERAFLSPFPAAFFPVCGQTSSFIKGLWW